jgi:hypothetical protein
MRITTITRMTLLALPIALALGCSPPPTDDGAYDETYDEEEELSAPAVVGSTSMCTQLDGRSVRVDRAAILAGPSANGANAVVVSDGATQRPTRGGQTIFVERGGRVEEDGSGGHVVFVAPGGSAWLGGGGGHTAFVRAGGSLDCTDIGGGNSVRREAGASLRNCGNPPTSTIAPFSRCSATTPADVIWPTVRCTTSRTGSSVTFRNTSTGTYSGATWQVIKIDRLTGTRVVVATSNASGGFTAELPAATGLEIYLATMRLSTPLSVRFEASCNAGL